jgi:DNA-directed RNA polymerase subunit F
VNLLAPYEVLEYHDIPNGIARKLIKEYAKKVGGEISELVKTVIEYLDKVSKCSDDAAEEVYNELKKYGLKETSIAMIINIVPQSIDELRTLLVFEEKIPDEQILKNIVELLNSKCKSEG